MRGRRTAALLAATGVLVGCSTTGEPLPAYSPQPSSIVVGAAANPLDPVVYPDAVQQRAVESAGEAAVARCMADRGFDYPRQLVFGMYQDPTEAQYTYGAADPGTAAVNGMRSQAWIDSMTRDRSGDGVEVEGFTAALFGDTSAVAVRDGAGQVIAHYDPESCAGRAKDEVTPDWAVQERHLEVAYQILLDSSERTATDERVVEAEAAWSACMAERGYDYAGLWDAWNSDEFGGELPTAREIEVAVAAARCQQDSGRLWTVSSVRAEYTQERLAQHPGLVTEWLAAQQRAVAGLPGTEVGR